MIEDFLDYYYTEGSNDPDANAWIYLYLSCLSDDYT